MFYQKGFQGFWDWTWFGVLGSCQVSIRVAIGVPQYSLGFRFFWVLVMSPLSS